VTDPTTGGLADTPGPDATPEQDADVRALLAFLRDEPMEMPPDVAARLDAVIAEERRTAAVATGSASATLDPSDAVPSPHASVTVLPTLEERRGPSMKTFAIVGGVAAAALVVVGGVALAGSLGSGSGASVASAGASAGPVGDAAGVTISASGTQYSTASLASQATALVVGKVATDRLGASAPAVPSPETVTGTSGGTATRSATGATSAPLAFALDKAWSCVAALTDGDGSSAVAIDSGTFNGKGALVVVVTDPEDAAALRVFVTAPDCSPNFFKFQQIAKP
jgi:hypothetical protein